MQVPLERKEAGKERVQTGENPSLEDVLVLLHAEDDLHLRDILLHIGDWGGGDLQL